MNEQAIKYIIRQAIFNSPDAVVNQAPGGRAYVSLDLNQGNTMVEAVFTSLKAAGALKVSK
jgi:hypothetical protein